MAILVTGGAGFIGSHVVERLIGRGEEVVVLDDFNAYYDPAIKEHNLAALRDNPALHLIRGDIADTDDVSAAFACVPIRAVIHLAGRAGVRPSVADPLLYELANSRGTLVLLEASRRAEVERFIFASSSSVYGITSRVPFVETDPADRAISPYAATKRAAEIACHTYSHLYGLPVTCLRLFTVYGPRQRPDLAIHAFTRDILAGREIQIFGDGSTARDYTYVTDIVDGLLAALDRPEPLRYEIINLGNSHPVMLRDLIQTLESVLDRPARIRSVNMQPGDVPLTYADITRARRLLDYAPRVALAEGLAQFAEWYVAQNALAEACQTNG